MDGELGTRRDATAVPQARLPFALFRGGQFSPIAKRRAPARALQLEGLAIALGIEQPPLHRPQLGA